MRDDGQPSTHRPFEPESRVALGSCAEYSRQLTRCTGRGALSRVFKWYSKRDIKMKTKANTAALAVCFSYRTATRSDCGRKSNGGAFCYTPFLYTWTAARCPAVSRDAGCILDGLANFEWISAVSFRKVKGRVSLSVRGIFAPSTLHSLSSEVDQLVRSGTRSTLHRVKYRYKKGLAR